MNDTLRTTGSRTTRSGDSLAELSSAGVFLWLDDLSLQRMRGMDDAVRMATTNEARYARDLFADIFERTGHVAGQVSIEVAPRLSHDTDATVAQTVELARMKDRANLLTNITASLCGVAADRCDPRRYDDPPYVVELVAPGSVNTGPEPTIDVVAGHRLKRGNAIEGLFSQELTVFASPDAAGIDLVDVFTKLERDEVEKFVQAWAPVLVTVGAARAEYRA